MSESKDETSQVGIPDEELPDDLVAGEDNPLAEGLPDGETVDGLLTEGKTAEGSDEGGDGDQDDRADADDDESDADGDQTGG